MQSNNQKFGAYSFFVCENFSTGYFTKFRLADNEKIWRHYQLTTPIEKNETLARERVKDLLANILIKKSN
jgi:hypothetical protein